MNRRDFVRLMGLASGAGLINSCGLERQTEKIIPYLVPPDDGVIPGVAQYKSTTCTECPAGCGVSAKVMDYRAAKLEGLPSHPIGQGALCARGQASIARLYHPDRLKRPLKRDAVGGFTEITWDEAYDAIIEAMRASSKPDVFLSGRSTGSLSAVIDRFCGDSGAERLPEFELFSYAAIRRANDMLFGRPEIPSYRIDDADFLLTIGADILETFVSPVENAARFGNAKRKGRFEWFHAEPHVSLTGLKAKERFTITPGSEPYLLTYLARKISSLNVTGDRRIAGIIEAMPDLPDQGYADKTGLTMDQLRRIGDHFMAARKPLIIAGGVSTMQQGGLEVALLAALLQWASGMIGSTVDFDRAVDYSRVGNPSDMQALSRRLRRSEIGTIFFADVDPVGMLAPTFAFAENLPNADFRVGMGQFMTDTLQSCDVILPLSDNLESWGDAVPKRGVTGIVQPVIEPLHDTRTTGDILLGLSARRAGRANSGTYQEYVFGRWTSAFGQRGVERMLDRGYAERRPAGGEITINRAEVADHLRRHAPKDGDAKPVLYVAPSLRAFDGRSADLALLSEVPDPLTTISHGGWVSISRESAAELKVADSDEVALSTPEWSAELPVKLQPGLSRGVMVVQFGAVRPAPMAVEVRSGELVSSFRGVSVIKTGKKIALPILSGSTSQEGRGVIPHPGGEEHHGGGHGEEGHDGHPTFYPGNPYPDYRWGMVIDLDLCIGCSACASACYVENNVPVVGPKLHLQGREMSWLRIEPFYEDGGDAELQPMLCQHCSNAPCETVCPVFATYHNPEGLNAQIYNRCVGTRYCANNCPYKVRRFNWFDHKRPTAMNTTRNPEVSVRGRGVMEKCTFCVQRIRAARDTAKDEKRKIRDGEVTPACAQTCPTNAITFGNLLDENSEVHKRAASDRAYRVFDLLGTESAVHYLRNNWKKDHA